MRIEDFPVCTSASYIVHLLNGRFTLCGQRRSLMLDISGRAKNAPYLHDCKRCAKIAQSPLWAKKEADNA